MKQLSRKLTLVLLLLLSAVLLLCGFMSLVPARAEDDNASAKLHGHEETGWYSLDYTADQVTFLLDANYRSYLDAGTADIGKLRNTITTALREILMEDILSSVGGGSPQTVSTRSAVTAYAIELPDKADLGKYEDYIRDLLSQKDEYGNFELENYLSGKYDAMIEYAVSTYVKENDISPETYEKLKDTVSSIVDEVIDEVYVPENGYTSYDREVRKEQAAQKTEEIVDRVQENGGEVTVTTGQILNALRYVTVNGSVVYEEATVRLAGVRTILGLLPRPSALATYTDEQMKSLISADIKIVTDFGNVEFTLTFGFDGDCKLIRKAAQTVADYVDFSFSGEAVSLDVRMPEVFTKAMLSLTRSEQFGDGFKHNLFAAFSKSVDELYDQYTAYSLEDIIGFLQSVDYQKWFTNFLSADFINSYFGNYLSGIFSRPLTDGDIDRVIDKLAGFVAPRLENLSEMTVGEVKDFLKKNVPGASSIGDGKLTTAATKLRNLLQKVDWANFNADYVRELLAKETFNDSVDSYLEKLGNYEELYSTFLRYLDKLYGYLPEDIKGTTILDTYLGGGAFAYEKTYTVDFARIFNKLESVAKNRGFERLGNIFHGVLNALDETSYEMDLSFGLTTKEIGKVTYTAGGEEYLSGLLPAGADVGFFANRSDVQNYAILKWVDEEGNEVTEMPASDIVLYAVTDFTVTAGEGYSGVYDEAAHEISVTANGVDYATYTYKWYVQADATSEKQAVEGATEAAIALTDVAESGIYTCEVTSDQGITHTSDPIEVSIAQRTIDLDLSAAAWENNDVVYSGEDFFGTVTLNYSATKVTEALYEQYITIEYSKDGEKITSAVDAGTYDLTVVSSATDDANTHYNFKAPTEKGTLTIRVLTVNVDLTGAKWQNLTAVYDGESWAGRGAYVDFSAANVPEELQELVLVSYQQNGAAAEPTDAGEYTVKVSLDDSKSTANVQYVLVNPIADGTFVIEQATKEIRLHGARFTPLEVVYSGEDFYGTVEINFGEAPATEEERAMVTVRYFATSDGADLAAGSMINVGTYGVEAVVKPGVSNANVKYVVVGITRGEFKITPAEISVNVTWGTATFEEDGTDHTLTYNYTVSTDRIADAKNLVVIEPTGTLTASKAGVYPVSLVFRMTAEAERNYILKNHNSEGTVMFSTTWSITAKAGPGPDQPGPDVPPGPTTGKTFGTEGKDDVIVIDQDDTLPDGAEIVTDKLDTKTIKVNLKGLREGYNGTVIAAYDISFTVDGAPFAIPSGNFTVKIRIPAGNDMSQTFAGLFINGETVEDLGGKVENGYVVFTTDHFSTYAIATFEEMHEANLWWLWTLLIIIVVLLAVLIVLLVILLLKKKNAKGEAGDAAPTEPTAPVDGDYEEDGDLLIRKESAAAVPVGTTDGSAPVVVMLPSDDDLVNILDRSFTSRLTQADDLVKENYTVVKNEFLSYKGVKSRTSWNYDTFNKGRDKLAKLQVRGKTLIMYLALDPADLNPKYHHKDMSAISKYKEVPTRFKVRSPRSIKYAKELIASVMSKYDIPQGTVPDTDYKVPYQTTEALLQLGLIRMKKGVPPKFWSASATAPAAEVAATETPAEETEAPATEEPTAPEAGDNGETK